MKAEILKCSVCGQLRMVEQPIRRPAVCGGEGLQHANGGQTHEWATMVWVATVDIEKLAGLS